MATKKEERESTVADDAGLPFDMDDDGDTETDIEEAEANEGQEEVGDIDVDTEEVIGPDEEEPEEGPDEDTDGDLYRASGARLDALEQLFEAEQARDELTTTIEKLKKAQKADMKKLTDHLEEIEDEIKELLVGLDSGSFQQSLPLALEREERRAPAINPEQQTPRITLDEDAPEADDEPIEDGLVGHKCGSCEQYESIADVQDRGYCPHVQRRVERAEPACDMWEVSESIGASSEICPECQGSGIVETDGGAGPCDTCGGEGEVWHQPDGGEESGDDGDEDACQECDGTGYITYQDEGGDSVTEPCPVCGGDDEA